MTSHSYFVVMIRYPRRVVDGVVIAASAQAVVDPEHTRRDIVDLIVTGEYPRDRIDFIDHIDGNYKETVTSEILAECDQPVEALSIADIHDAARDHARDLLKHEVV